MKKAILVFFIAIILQACSRHETGNGLSIVLSGSIDSLLHDTTFISKDNDSLKKVVFNSKSDTSLVDNLCILAQNSSSQNRLLLSGEIISLSSKIAYQKGKYKGKILQSTYLIALQKYAEADSILSDVSLAAKQMNDDYLLSRCFLHLAEINRLTYKFDTAEGYYSKALSLAEKNKDEEVIAFVNSTWSQIFDKKGDYKKAIAMDSTAIFFARKRNDFPRLAYALSGMGEKYRMRGQLPKALSCMQEAYRYGELTNNKKRMVYCLLTIGNLYIMEDDFVNAKKNYLLALTKVSKKDKITYSNLLSSLGALHINLKEYQQALVYYNGALKISREAGEFSIQQFSLYSMGEIYEQMDRHDSSEYYFLSALKISDELKMMDQSAMCNKALGQLYFKMGNKTKAESYGRMGLSQAVKSKTPVNIKESSFALYEILKSNLNYKEALEMHELYLNSKDSIGNENQIKALEKVRYHAKEESLKINQQARDKAYVAEKAKKDEEIKNQKLIRNSFVFGFIAIGLLAFFIFRSLMLNRKAKKIIEDQKQQVELQKNLVEEHQREIIDSITYARRIQQSLLPTEKYIERTINRLRKK